MNSLFAFGNKKFERIFIKNGNWSHVIGDNDSRNTTSIHGRKYTNERGICIYCRSEFIQHQDQRPQSHRAFDNEINVTG